MPELSADDRDLVVSNLQASARWLALLSGRLADGGEPEAAGLTETARRDIVAVCRRLRGDLPERGGYNFADLYGSDPPVAGLITETGLSETDDADDPEELPPSKHTAEPLAEAAQPQSG